MRAFSRLLLSGIFIYGGWNAFLQPGGRVNAVAKAGISDAQRAVELNGAAMVVGGTMLALGIAPKLAALFLLASLIPTTIVGHPFWKEEAEAGRKNQLTQFFKNLGLMGALLLILADREK